MYRAQIPHFLVGVPGVPVFLVAAIVQERIAVAGKGIVARVFGRWFIGNHHIQRGRAAQPVVDGDHALVNLGRGFEVIDKAVFHRQPVQADHTQHSDDCRADQDGAAEMLGKAGKGIGEGHLV